MFEQNAISFTSRPVLILLVIPGPNLSTPKKEISEVIKKQQKCGLGLLSNCLRERGSCKLAASSLIRSDDMTYDPCQLDREM